MQNSQQTTQTQYFSSKKLSSQIDGLHEGQQQSELESSRISSVRLTDEYSTFRSEAQAKPNQLDKIAGLLTSGFGTISNAHDISEEDKSDQINTAFGSTQSAKDLIKRVSMGMRLKLLDTGQKQGIIPYRKLQQSFSQGNKIGQITSKFSIDYIMRAFDVEKLRVLKEKFMQKQKDFEDGFSLVEFIDLMKKVIPYSHPAEECDLVHGLCALFSEIDINGNGFMEWDEFTSFLIEAVDQKQLHQINAKLTAEEFTNENVLAHHLLKIEESAPDYLHTNNMLQVARSHIFQQYRLSGNFKDHIVRNGPIIRAILYHATDTFITLEQGATSVKLVTAMSNQAIPSITNQPSQSTRIQKQISLPNPGSTYILSVAFNEKDKVLALCSTDAMIYFYRKYGNQHDWKLFKIICSHGISVQVSMWYLKHHDIWVSIGSQKKGNYSRKDLAVGQLQILHRWKIPRSKWIANNQMQCSECQQGWSLNRAAAKTFVSDYCIERPYIEETDHLGKVRWSKDNRYLEEPFEHMGHRDDVKDVREMYHPFMAIITACHDGKLRIISTAMKRIVGILHAGHSTGLRQIDYTPYHGAAIISTGYESFFNLWEIENSASFGKQMQDLPTKFKMLSSPCIAAMFLGQSSFCVGIDSQFIVKIWNYRKRELMQSLHQSSLKLRDQITGLLIFSEGKFAVLSKHVTFYDTIANKLQDSDAPNLNLKKNELEIRRTILREKGLSEIQQAAIQQRDCMINPPIDVVFLESYKNFLVLTKDSLRVYNGKNGRLRMYLDSIVEKDERTQSLSELTSMCLNSEHRMVYVGDIHGGIKCYNVNTGLLIKKMKLDQLKAFQQGELNPTINKEICQMQYVDISEEHQFLVSAQWNSRLRIWDVANMDEANHMRSASAQKEFSEDIQCVAVSEHLCLIATGSLQGRIIIWDLELLKCEGVLLSSKQSIVALHFVDEFPMLLSASECGILSLFSVRGSPTLIRRLCLGRFLNVSPDHTGQMVNTAITGMTFEVVANPRYDPEKKEYGELAMNISYFKRQQANKNKNGKEVEINNYTKSVFRARHDNSFQSYKSVFNEPSIFDKKEESKKGQRRLSKIASKIETKDLDPDEGVFECEDKQKLIEKYYPPFGNKQNPEFLNVVISDEAGSIKWLDLTTFIRKPNQPSSDEQLLHMQENIEQSEAPPYLKKCQRYADSKMGFMPSRRMDTEAGSLALAYLEISKKRTLPPLVLAAQSVQSHCVKNAHKGRINNIRRINVEPYGYATCGNDKYVRIWSKSGVKVGEINLIKENTKLNDWRFGFDWAQKKRDEEKRALAIVQSLKMGTIHETQGEYQSHITQAEGEDLESMDSPKQKPAKVVSPIRSPREKELRMSYSRPALDNLVKEPTDNQLTKMDLYSYENRRKDQSASQKNPDKKEKRPANNKKRDNISEIASMFPLVEKSDPNQISQYEQNLVFENAKFLDDIVNKQFLGRNPLQVSTRQTQSQATLRRLSENKKGAVVVKSSLRDTHTNIRQQQKSSITFKMDPIVPSQSTNQNTQSTFKQIHPPNKMEAGFIAKSESSETEEVCESLSSQSRDGQNLNGNIKSQTEVAIAQRINEMNQSKNRLTAIFAQKTYIKKNTETSIKKGSSTEQQSAQSKSFKVIEAQHDKLTQRSVSSLRSMKESTDRTSATREKWQRKPPTKVIMRHQTVANGSLSAAKMQLKQQLKQSQTAAILPTHAELALQIEKQKSMRQTIVDQVNQKTDQHLHSLMKECESRHQQMQEYMDQRKTNLGASKSMHQFEGELRNSLSIDGATRVQKDVLESIQQKKRDQEVHLRTAERPPRSGMAWQRRPGRNSQQAASHADLNGPGPQKSRFLNKINQYINESTSNPTLDDRYMMHKSHSQADFNRNAFSISMATTGSKYIERPSPFDKNRQSQVSFNPVVESRPSSQLGGGGGKVREMQRLIARHISQKNFNRPDSMSQLNKAIIDFGQLDKEGQAQTSRQQDKGLPHRQDHLNSASIKSRQPSRVTQFLSKYQQERSNLSATPESFNIAKGQLSKANQDL